MSTNDNAEKVEVPPEVYAELEALRESGMVNMFMEVKHGLREMGFETALEWVNENPETYIEGFKKGIKPADEK